MGKRTGKRQRFRDAVWALDADIVEQHQDPRPKRRVSMATLQHVGLGVAQVMNDDGEHWHQTKNLAPDMHLTAEHVGYALSIYERMGWLHRARIYRRGAWHNAWVVSGIPTSVATESRDSQVADSGIPNREVGNPESHPNTDMNTDINTVGDDDASQHQRGQEHARPRGFGSLDLLPPGWVYVTQVTEHAGRSRPWWLVTFGEDGRTASTIDPDLAARARAVARANGEEGIPVWVTTRPSQHDASLLTLTGVRDPSEALDSGWSDDAKRDCYAWLQANADRMPDDYRAWLAEWATRNAWWLEGGDAAGQT